MESIIKMLPGTIMVASYATHIYELEHQWSQNADIN